MLDYHVLDVFTEHRYGGNPLAVVLGGEGFTTARMQAIAREFNLSETVFVLPPEDPATAFRLRIFTPAQELPFAGHPTVGTACLLALRGLVQPAAGETKEVFGFVLGETVGPVPVQVRLAEGAAAYAELTAAVLPSRGPAAPSDTPIAIMLGLVEDDLGCGDERPRFASCGVPFLLVPLRRPELLAAIELDPLCWRELLGSAWANKVYVYARGYDGELRARMFAPGAGVPEDPATGSAAVALAGLLALESPQADGRLEWTIEQGHEMGRPSRLFASADKRAGEVIAVRVGGHAVTVMQGRLET